MFVSLALVVNIRLWLWSYFNPYEVLRRNTESYEQAKIYNLSLKSTWPFLFSEELEVDDYTLEISLDVS